MTERSDAPQSPLEASHVEGIRQILHAAARNAARDSGRSYPLGLEAIDQTCDAALAWLRSETAPLDLTKYRNLIVEECAALAETWGGAPPSPAGRRLKLAMGIRALKLPEGGVPPVGASNVADPELTSTAQRCVAVPVGLYQRILTAHQDAADALVDKHGDEHRRIVIELRQCERSLP